MKISFYDQQSAASGIDPFSILGGGGYLTTSFDTRPESSSLKGTLLGGHALLPMSFSISLFLPLAVFQIINLPFNSDPGGDWDSQ